MDIFENCARRQDVVINHNIAHCLQVEAAKQINERERFERGSKHSRPAERFDANAIASSEGRATVSIPNHKGEHSVLTINDFRAPPAVTFENDLGVGMRFELSAVRAQKLPKFGKVVDLPIKDDNVTTVPTFHRLIAGRKVNNRKPAMPQVYAAFPPFSIRVRTSMRNRIQ
jgi:hypothetical protein